MKNPPLYQQPDIIQLFRNANQVIPAGVWTKINYDVLRYNDFMGWDTTTFEVVIPDSAFYEIGYSVAGSAASFSGMSIRVNGVQLYTDFFGNNLSAFFKQWTIDFNANDRISFYIFSGAGGTLQNQTFTKNYAHICYLRDLP